MKGLLLESAAHHRMLVEWNDTAHPYPLHKCVHELFEEQVRQTPALPALCLDDLQLTYQELDCRANQLAHYLRELGVGPETFVGVSMQRSVELIVGLLGILKAGGVYVPLDPFYPRERLAFMMQDAGVKVLLTQRSLVDGFPCYQAHTICLDSDWLEVSRHSNAPLSLATSPNNLAYVIYTSGSTGQPKGVLLEHAGLCNLICVQREVFALGRDCCVLQFASPSFDAAVSEIFMALCSGATLLLAHQEILAGPDLQSYLRDKQVTHVTLAPTLLSVLREDRLPHLRVVISAGEACNAELTRRWGRGRVFVNAYGPAEYTVCSTIHVCSGDEEGTPPIGRPIANTRCYILDHQLQPVPVGVSGELYVGGVGLARGYLNRTDLTAERFIADPFCPGERMYKTGDLARYLPDGNIDFLGRADHQVKIHGIRIEVDEIKAVLLRHPDILDAIVIAREDIPGNKRLVAYIVVRDSLAPSTIELRAHLSAIVPAHMVPAAFVLLPELPLTPNGKVDRQALFAPEMAPSTTEENVVLPRTQTEKLLAAIWSDVLRRDVIGVYDNFFEIGGDSILSMQIITRARQAGVHLTPRQFFQHQTVAALATVVRETVATPAADAPVTGDVPLLPMQRWFFEQELRESHHWNQCMMLEVMQELRMELLRDAFLHVVQYHDAFRLRFSRTPDGWRQEYQPFSAEPPVAFVDLANVPHGEEAAAINAAASRVQGTLNFETGPLVRATYFHLGPQRTGRLLLVAHHLVVDGVSWRVILEDLDLAYSQLSRGEPVQLPPKTTSLQQWGHRLVEYAHSPTAQKAVRYWLDQPKTVPLAFPLDVQPPGDNLVSSADAVVMTLPMQETQDLLQKVPSAYNTQISDVLLAALAITFRRRTGQQIMVLSLEGHGREERWDDIDVSRTVGWFTSFFPAYIDIGGAESLGEIITVVKEQLRRIPDKGAAYGIVRYLAPDSDAARGLSAGPQPDCVFNYLGQFGESESLFRFSGEPSGVWHSPVSRRVSIIDIGLMIVRGCLQVRWTFSTQLHHRETIVRAAEEYCSALRDIIRHCLSPDAGGYTPSDFALAALSQKELDDILSELNDLQ